MSDVLEVKTELSQRIDYGLVISDLQTKVTADLALTIDGLNDKAGYKLCDQRRKEWVRVRTGIDRRRKEMNAAAREHIKKVDAVAAEFTELAGQAEDHVTRLVDQIDAQVAAAEKEKADAVFNARNSQLQHVGIELNRLVVESLTDEQISAMIDEKIVTDRLKREEAERVAAAKAEADRLAAEQADRNRIEAEKLAAERAEFARLQAAQKAEMDAQRKLLEEAQRKIEEAAFAVAEREREQREAEQRKIDDELAAKKKAEADAFEAERLKLLEEKAAQDAAEKLEHDKAEAEAARQRSLALKPSRDRLRDFADQVQALKVPTLDQKDVMGMVANELLNCADAIRRIVEERVR